MSFEGPSPAVLFMLAWSTIRAHGHCLEMSLTAARAWAAIAPPSEMVTSVLMSYEAAIKMGHATDFRERSGS